MSVLDGRLSAFRQWADGAGPGRAEWVITRTDAAFMFARLEATLAEAKADAEALAEALRLAVGDLLEAEGKPRTGPGADLAVESFLAQARYRGEKP